MSDRPSASVNHFRTLTRLERFWSICIAAIVVGTFAISAAQAIESSWTTVGDEVRFGAEARVSAAKAPRPDYAGDNLAFSIRAFGVPTTADLHGADSVFQPGPVPHLLAMPFVKALGVRDGLWIFAATVNAVALLVAAWSALRISGPLISAWIAACGFLTVILTTGTLTSALNVNLAVLPCFAAFVVSWGLARGDLPMLPVLAALVSLILQIHIAYGLTPLLVSVVAVGLLVVRGQLGALLCRRHFLPAILVLLMFWLLPAIDQLVGSGNLGKLLTTRIPGEGVEGAWHGLGAILRIPPAIRPQTDVLTAPSPLGLLLVALCVWAVVTYRKKLVASGELLAIGVSVLGGSLLVAAMSPSSGTSAYHLYWIGLAVGFGVAAIGVPLLPLLQDVTLRHVAEPTRSHATILLSVSLLAASAVPLLRPTEPSPRDARVMAATLSLAHDLASGLDPATRWNVTSRGGYSAEEIANGIAAHLTDAGFAIRQSPDALPGERTLVVSSGSLRTEGRGRSIARYGAASKDLDSLTARLEQYAAGNQPLLISDADQSATVKYLDGRAASVCTSDLQLDRAQMKALDPGALAGLFGHDQIISPVLPGDLRYATDQWLAQQDFTVYELDNPSSYGELAFSEDECDDD